MHILEVITVDSSPQSRTLAKFPFYKLCTVSFHLRFLLSFHTETQQKFSFLVHLTREHCRSRVNARKSLSLVGSPLLLGSLTCWFSSGHYQSPCAFRISRCLVSLIKVYQRHVSARGFLTTRKVLHPRPWPWILGRDMSSFNDPLIFILIQLLLFTALLYF